MKRIIVLLLLLGFCLGLTACGRGESDAMAAAEPTELSVKSTLDSRERLRYAAEQISLPEGQRIDLVSGLVPLEGRRPAWLGEEVTGDRRYYNARLVVHPFSSWTQE